MQLAKELTIVNTMSLRPEERKTRALLHNHFAVDFMILNAKRLNLVLHEGETVEEELGGTGIVFTSKTNFISTAISAFIATQSSIPFHLPLLTSVKIVSCSETHALFGTETSVYAIGHGVHGQLGLGNHIQSVAVPHVISLPPNEVPKSIAVSDYHSCIVTSPQGYLYTFGCGAFYRLGHGDDDNDLFLPRRVDSLLAVGAWQANGQSAGVEKVACSMWHTAVLVTGMHDVYAWGWNNFGQCSDEAEMDTTPLSSTQSPIAKRPRIDHDNKQSSLGGIMQTKKKMIISPERITSLDSINTDSTASSWTQNQPNHSNEESRDIADDEVIDIACGHRFTAFLTRQGHVLLLGQLETTEIDHVDLGVNWWCQSFSPSSSESATTAAATIDADSSANHHDRHQDTMHTEESVFSAVKAAATDVPEPTKDTLKIDLVAQNSTSHYDSNSDSYAKNYDSRQSYYQAKDRNLRFLHRASSNQDKNSTSSSGIYSPPATHIAAYQWSVAYLTSCSSSADS